MMDNLRLDLLEERQDRLIERVKELEEEIKKFKKYYPVLNNE